MIHNIRPNAAAAWLLGWVIVILWPHPGQLLAVGEPRIVTTTPSAGAFPLFAGRPATLLVDSNDWPGVVRAVQDLAQDLRRVTGQQPAVLNHPPATATNLVIIGALNQSPLMQQLVRAGKLNGAELAGQWESYRLETVTDPLPGVTQALVICGSDKRGAIYGVYTLSGQIGVSPWHWWADVPPQRHEQLFVPAGKYSHGPPGVKYRGIFINDEAPALTEWVREKYGSVPGYPNSANYGAGFYTNVFELLLRLRANYLWPAMWNNAFNEDDPDNPVLADRYGIVMGTSHQEPMLRAQQEWDRGPRRQHGLWDYNKSAQRPALQQFWRDGIRRNKNFESIITMGLRAENDSGAPVGKDLTAEIIAGQRRILAEEMNPDLTQVPQLWCLYKEVMGYYDDGLRVPDDVTLLWAEDNWGNVRRLPTAAERQRPGGAGIYYHFDYHGGPRSYQWINTSPIAKIWDQLSLAKQYAADRIWIVNVGHLNKSGEFPLEFFLNLAWAPPRWTHDNLDEFTRDWAAREFGASQAEEIASLITTSTRFNGRRKPELLDPNTYSLLHYREFETVVAEYTALANRAQQVSATLPAASRDAFYGMILYPIKACAELNAMYLAAAKNALHARQRRASANDFAAQTRAAFSAQTNLAHHFNRVFAGGKWNHFMDQPFIGYTSWNPPRQNNLNAIRLTELTIPEPAAMGVAVEGDTQTTGGTLAFDRYGQATRYVEVFNQGQTPFTFTASADQPWIALSSTQGTVTKEQRLEVGVQWALLPPGTNTGTITFTGTATNFSVTVQAHNRTIPPLDAPAFVAGDGYIAIEAEHFSQQTAVGSNRWLRIANYGHTLSGMRADGPVETLTTPGQDAPCLEYRVYLFTAGKLELESIFGPTLGFLPDRPLRFAVSFDAAPPQIVTVVPKKFDGHYTNPAWSEAVINNCHRIKSTHTLATPGEHTLKIWMVDPGLVLQKLVLDCGGQKPSYLGPPESRRIEGGKAKLSRS